MFYVFLIRAFTMCKACDCCFCICFTVFLLFFFFFALFLPERRINVFIEYVDIYFKSCFMSILNRVDSATQKTIM